MDILRLLTDAELDSAYERVFREAFPPEELKPLFSMVKMRSEGQYDCLGLFRDGEALGYVCCWLDGEYILIDYLCVDRSARNCGIGSEILRMLRDYYPDVRVFIVETEAPTGDEAADAMIYRRLGFYERSGARKLGYDCALFGVHYRNVCWAEGEVDEEEVCRRHDGFYRRNFTPERYAQAIQLPLKDGVKPFDRAIWDERPNSEKENEI